MRSISVSIKFSFVIGLMINMFSCIPVKEYQKMYLNDAEMELVPRKVEYAETNFFQYREGGSGANGGRAGGGCGCN